jgi:CheY-like chemotaxis protein
MNTFDYLGQVTGLVGVPSINTKTTALIAEDDPGVQVVLSRMAQRAGLEVLIACDGAEALETFAQSPTPLVFTDLNMPRMNGLELLYQIKTSHPDTFVVLVTANYEQTPPNTGVDLILKKPFRLVDFDAIIQAFYRARPEWSR